MKRTRPQSDQINVIETLSLSELCAFCHTQPDWIIGLVDHGVIDPMGTEKTVWRFAAPCVARARKARRLARDLGINLPGIALALELIDERDALARRLFQEMENT